MTDINSEQTSLEQNKLKKIKYSIIIPSYNYGHLITRALDSILTQTILYNSSPTTWPETKHLSKLSKEIKLEIVIIDDHSSDNTIEIIEKYLEKNFNSETANTEIIIINNSTNYGPAYSRNLGIESCTGDYLLFLDADDYLTNDAIYNIHHAILDNTYKNTRKLPEVIIANHNNFILDQDNRIKILTKKNKSNYNISNNPEQRFIDYLFNKTLSLTAGSVIFHRNFFNKIKFSESLKQNEDLLVFATAALCENLIYIDSCTVNIYKHQNSLRHQYQYLDEEKNITFLANSIFDPLLIPKRLLSLKNKYISLRYLSLFRSYYIARQYKISRKFYYKAIRYNFISVLKLNYLSKFLKSLTA